MRRFEFVEGTSAKFWMAATEGTTFVVVYGRLGTAGKRQEKAFPSEDAARKELDRKISEKLREGYHEVAADAAASAPAGARGAAAASARLALPPRAREPRTDDAHVQAAAKALAALADSAGRRSWVVRAAGDRARRAIRALGCADPTGIPALRAPFEALLALAVGGKGQRKIPLEIVCSLLAGLDVAAYERALAVWKDASGATDRAPVLEALAKQRASLDEPELSLRLGALLSARPGRAGTGSVKGVARRFAREVKPHLEAYLVSRGGRLRAQLDGIDARGDRTLAAVVASMKSA
jgi:predicted DNA-binding WGR domain protein